MARPKFIGYITLIASVSLFGLFLFNIFFKHYTTPGPYDTGLEQISQGAYYAITVPIGVVTFFVLGTGFWIGYTILTIKVVPPMPEIVEKKDHSKIKAFFLCLATLALAVFFMYGLYIKSYWALAIPAAAISIVILGAIFWVGLAIVTTRSTLPEKETQE